MIGAFIGPNRFLSNFYRHYVAFEHLMYPTNEHAFQAAKTLDIKTRVEINRCTSPGQAKRLGRSLWDTPLMRPDWDRIKLDIMLGLVREKFTDKRMREWLLSTGTQELVEGNPWGDVYWGVCKGHGQNHLGRLLMQVREEVRVREVLASKSAKSGV